MRSDSSGDEEASDAPPTSSPLNPAHHTQPNEEPLNSRSLGQHTAQTPNSLELKPDKHPNEATVTLESTVTGELLPLSRVETEATSSQCVDGESRDECVFDGEREKTLAAAGALGDGEREDGGRDEGGKEESERGRGEEGGGKEGWREEEGMEEEQEKEEGNHQLRGEDCAQRESGETKSSYSDTGTNSNNIQLNDNSFAPKPKDKTIQINISVSSDSQATSAVQRSTTERGRDTEREESSTHSPAAADNEREEEEAGGQDGGSKVRSCREDSNEDEEEGERREMRRGSSHSRSKRRRRKEHGKRDGCKHQSVSRSHSRSPVRRRHSRSPSRYVCFYPVCKFVTQ